MHGETADGTRTHTCGGRRTARQRAPVGPTEDQASSWAPSDECPRRLLCLPAFRAGRVIRRAPDWRKNPAPRRVARPEQPFIATQRNGAPAVKGGPTGPSAASRRAAPLTAGRSGATQAHRATSAAKLTTSMPREPYLLVESSVSCPSHNAIVAVSTGVGARSSRIAAVWRSACGVMFLPASDGHRARAVVVCLTTSRQIALRVRCPPLRLGNSGLGGSPSCSRSHTRSTCLAAWVERGASFLSALAFAPDPASAEVEVLAAQARELGHSQPGLHCQQQQCVVTPAGRGGAVRRGQQRVDLWFGEVADQR